MLEQSPECPDCGGEVNPRRVALGHPLCLVCGETLAQKEIARRAMCVAPAYNKGAYMYVTSASMARDAGK